MRPDDQSAVHADAMDELTRRVAASLAADRVDSLATELAACVRNPASYEASVRATSGGALSAGRMMIEGASPQTVDAIARALGVVLPAAERWFALAAQEGVPLIAGWDRRGGGEARCVKLYVNASDVSRAARARLCAALAPGVGSDEPAAVVGMNARADGGTETKLYLQSADAVTLAAPIGARARALADAARRDGADAGGVLSFDVAGATLRPRAFFVALREPAGGSDWRCVASLPGYDANRIAALLPFPPAPPRSVGVALDDATWTLYCKPRGSGRAPEALEPTAIFRSAEAEVGVFVEPTAHAVRAFRRTARYAISVRVRDGRPAPYALESLVDWFTARLGDGERDNAALVDWLADPPAPWQRVDTASADRVRARS